MEPVVIADSFSVVVVGRMNPAIHHPLWYQHNKLLEAPEVEHALTNEMMCAPAFAGFNTPTLSITCDNERWEVATPHEEHVRRLQEIAGRTFDTLTHTPITAFGFNFRFHRATEQPSVAAVLVSRLHPKALGLVEDGVNLIEIATKRNDKHCVRNVRVAQSVLSPVHVFVAVNAHYRVDQSLIGEPGHFELIPLLERFFSDDYDVAKEQVTNTMQALSKGGT